MEKTLEEKKKLAAKVIAALKKRIPGCRLHPGLQRGVETFSQCPPCGSVYRRQSQCGSPGSLQKVSGCEGIGGSRCGRDRGDRPPLRPWKKQGPGHQRLHEDSLRAVSRKRTG